VTAHRSTVRSAPDYDQNNTGDGVAELQITVETV
jgi:hypothetical protein